jgi:HD-GYP domain-containing protein (c-di-GMP phosphodiesterase class II)
MKKISTKSLKAGLSFTDPVYIEGNNLLVPAGIPIKKKDLIRLDSWGIDTVYTAGNIIAESPLGDEIPVKGKDAVSKNKQNNNVLYLPEVQENKGIYRTYVDLVEKVDIIFSNIASGFSVEARSIDTIAGNMVHMVREQHEHMVGFILGSDIGAYEFAKSSVNSAILSALTGLEMKLPNHKVMQITTGALLHDVGMLRLPKDMLEKKGNLSDAETQRMQAHPLYSYKVVCKEFLYPEDVGLVVLQHHERWNGEGYPRRTSGTNIDIGARIVSVADAFEAMVSEKSYRDSMMGYQAMKNLLSDNSRRFDPEGLKAFIRIMGIYPIGSIILLNNGTIARVVEVRKESPLRPSVRPIIDEFGKVYTKDEGDLIDLITEQSLFIARALDPRELSSQKGSAPA